MIVVKVFIIECADLGTIIVNSVQWLVVVITVPGLSLKPRGLL